MYILSILDDKGATINIILFKHWKNVIAYLSREEPKDWKGNVVIPLDD